MGRRFLGQFRSLVRGTAVLALLLGVVLALAGAGWIAYTQRARVLRETESVEQLAAGTGRWVQVEDAALYVQEWGRPTDPVLLLTHGTGAWSGTWFELPGALAAAGWRVVALDLPPFGLTKTAGFGSAVDYSRVAQAKRILSLIEGLGSPVTLVGHSFGAGPALEAAMRGGDKLRQLVLVDPALGLGTNGEPPQCDPDAGPSAWLSNRSLRTTLVSATATWPGLSATLLRQFVHRKEVVTERLVPAYQVPFRRRSFSANLGDWAASFSQASCEPAESLDIDKLGQWAAGGIPVSLIWGEEDTITPIAQGRALLRWMPGTKLIVVPGVGHIPHIESPDAFAAALLDAVRPAR